MERAVTFAVCLLMALQGAAMGETYRVGPGEETTKLSAVVDSLAPGDVVEITGDIKDSCILRTSGTPEAPITIRGAGDERPVIDFGGARNGIETRGSHWVIEHLALKNASSRGVFHHSHDLTIRDCYFEGNDNGIMGADSPNTGDILLEYCEFYKNGSGIYGHQIYLASFKPGAKATVQFNYFHDSSGGTNIKTRMPRNIIRYNWIENAHNYECDLVDSDRGPDSLRPMHLLFLGNVVVTGVTGNPHHQMNVASDQPRSPGTSNTYMFVDNLFVMNRESHENHMMRVGGDPAEVSFYNNVFVGPRLKSFFVLSIEDVRAEEGPAGSEGRVRKLIGSSNFVAANASRIPPEWTGTLRADSAGFADFEGSDFTLKSDSALKGAAGDAPVAALYSPVRDKTDPGDEMKRTLAEKGDLGPYGAAKAGSSHDPVWPGD